MSVETLRAELFAMILRGGYTDDFGIRPPGDNAGPPTGTLWTSWTPSPRPQTTDAHTITALLGVPIWTLLLAGRRRPEPSWAYWENSEWVPHDQHPHDLEFAAALATRHGQAEP